MFVHAANDVLAHFQSAQVCARGLAAGLVPASSEKDIEGQAVVSLLLAETLVRQEQHLASYGQDEELAVLRSAADGSWGG